MRPRLVGTTPAALLALLVLAWSPTAAVIPPPTLAKEDTIALASGSLPEVLVTAPRVTLDEILHRVAAGEARRDSFIQDQAFTATVRVVKDVVGGQPQLVSEQVTRVYKKKPELIREVPLRRWPEKKQGVQVEAQFTPSTAERIVSFAFLPEMRDRYRFHILGRDLVGGHVIYRVGFEPRSPLAPFAPRGQVWIETNEFVVVRQESSFERSPVPLVFKSIDRLVVERGRTGDGFWVMSRLLMRAQATVSLPTLGRSFDLAVTFSDYQNNAGLDDAFFAAPGGRRVKETR